MNLLFYHQFRSLKGPDPADSGRDSLNRRSAKLITIGELKISEVKPAEEMQRKNGTLKVQLQQSILMFNPTARGFVALGRSQPPVSQVTPGVIQIEPLRGLKNYFSRPFLFIYLK